MVEEIEFPASVMYGDLKAFGRVSNKEAAKVLLSAKPVYGGVAPRSRIEERTFLSREVVHAKPGEKDISQFSDFATSAINLTAKMMNKLGAGAIEEIIDHYSSEALVSMRASLEACGMDSNLYKNQVSSIINLELSRKTDYAVMLVLAFVSTGCLGDPRLSALIVEQFVKEKLNSNFNTVQVSSSMVEKNSNACSDEQSSNVGLGLARMVDDKIRPKIYHLSCSEEGTIIGALPTSKNGISDVGDFVSKKHCRVYLNDGKWYIEGLNSTNGTIVKKGGTEEVVVESPRSHCPDSIHNVVELEAGDVICLASTTQYVVLELLEEE